MATSPQQMAAEAAVEEAGAVAEGGAAVEGKTEEAGQWEKMQTSLPRPVTLEQPLVAHLRRTGTTLLEQPLAATYIALV